MHLFATHRRFGAIPLELKLLGDLVVRKPGIAFSSH